MGNVTFLLYVICDINYFNWVFNNYFAFCYPIFFKFWLLQKNEWVNILHGLLPSMNQVLHSLFPLSSLVFCYVLFGLSIVHVHLLDFFL